MFDCFDNTGVFGKQCDSNEVYAAFLCIFDLSSAMLLSGSKNIVSIANKTSNTEAEYQHNCSTEESRLFIFIMFL